MTIPAGQGSRSQWVGTGTVSTYDYQFKITDKADLRVSTTDLEGLDTELVLDIDYTVADVGDNSGGTITLLGGDLAIGYLITLEDNIQASQTTPFSNQSAFFAELHENAFDKLTRLTKRSLDLIINNVLRLPDTVVGVDPVLPKPVPLSLFRYNADATALEQILPDEIATSVAFSDFKYDHYVNGADFTAGVTDQLVMTESPGQIENTQIFFDGVYQEKNTYSMPDPTTVLFGAPIPGVVGEVEIAYGTAVPSDQTLAAKQYADEALASKTAAASSAVAANEAATTAAQDAVDLIALTQGTAAGLDTGTEAGQLPTNSDLDIPNKVVQKDSITGAAKLPAGTLLQRPSAPVPGMFRFNSETVQFEGYSAGAWSGVGGASGGAGNPVMYEHDAEATENYTLKAGKNSISGGPFTIADGVEITVESGAAWTIV